jgi:hypothetical protein
VRDGADRVTRTKTWPIRITRSCPGSRARGRTT